MTGALIGLTADQGSNELPRVEHSEVAGAAMVDNLLESPKRYNKVEEMRRLAMMMGFDEPR